MCRLSRDTDQVGLGALSPGSVIPEAKCMHIPIHERPDSYAASMLLVSDHAGPLQVMQLGAEELGELVVAAMNTAALQPAAMLQAFMDHSHASYAADLRAAAAQRSGGHTGQVSRALQS